DFCTMPPMRLMSIGYGHGKRETGTLNSLRVWLGETEEACQPVGREDMCLLETNIDDMSGEAFGHLFEKIFQAGAADAWLTPIQMKKNRPAVLVSVICRMELEQALIACLLGESTTLGVRQQRVARTVLPRTLRSIHTSYGVIRVKYAGGRAMPEYEDCHAAANLHHVSFYTVYQVAQEAAMHE
ncbi:MAG: LarC family nickel insertion protein, partial [Clostridia bacterium]